MNRANENDGWVRSPDGSLGFTCSYITGCWRRCSYCFAWALAKGRVRSRYLANRKCAPNVSLDKTFVEGHADPFWPRVWPERLDEIYERKKPAGIFMNIMGEWADNRIPIAWKAGMFDCMEKCPQHVFYLLTKCHEQLIPYVFPDNCVVGASVTDSDSMKTALKALALTKARSKFLSVEPLLGEIIWSKSSIELLRKSGVSWVIIGTATGTLSMLEKVGMENPALKIAEYGGRHTLQPPTMWVTKTIITAKSVGCKVYLKNNLYPSYVDMDVIGSVQRPYWTMPGGDGYELRQEVLFG